MIKPVRSTIFQKLISMSNRNPQTIFNNMNTLTSPSSSQQSNLIAALIFRPFWLGHRMLDIISFPWPVPGHHRPFDSQFWSNFSPVTLKVTLTHYSCLVQSMIDTLLSFLSGLRGWLTSVWFCEEVLVYFHHIQRGLYRLPLWSAKEFREMRLFSRINLE